MRQLDYVKYSSTILTTLALTKHILLLLVATMVEKDRITINVPLFKKMRDIMFFLRDYHFLSHFKGLFEGAETFLTP